jgi:hypothetical protein
MSRKFLIRLPSKQRIFEQAIAIEERAMAIPTDLDTRLRRDATAAALEEAGYPTSPKTLATLASRGGGPKFRKYGRYPIYRWGDALAWAEAKCGPVVTSTAELDAAHQHDQAQATG